MNRTREEKLPLTIDDQWPPIISHTLFCAADDHGKKNHCNKSCASEQQPFVSPSSQHYSFLVDKIFPKKLVKNSHNYYSFIKSVFGCFQLRTCANTLWTKWANINDILSIYLINAQCSVVCSQNSRISASIMWLRRKLRLFYCACFHCFLFLLSFGN